MTEKIPFKMHPRVFAALGADLVTNDVVAMLELVKNSYDAFAKNVWIRFLTDDNDKPYIEIQDDGHGMDRYTIENVWSVVATPFRVENTIITLDGKERRVSGEKGLGRLSVARLGDQLLLQTRAHKEPCWEIAVDWESLSSKNELDACLISLSDISHHAPFKGTGTFLRITELRQAWSEARLRDLKENLARLISPFPQMGKFDIHFIVDLYDINIKSVIKPEKFLSKPPYRIKGAFGEKRGLEIKYRHQPIEGTDTREYTQILSWKQIARSREGKNRELDEETSPICGPFKFDIRAWDLSVESIGEISERYQVRKTQIRKSIGVHKGISVYRDGILVLPKSNDGKDWLGMDLRRISKVGTRISTSQVLGHVDITADDNPKLTDTSDREKLASSREVDEFSAVLLSAIALLENERDKDRRKPEEFKPLEDLFDSLSLEPLVAQFQALEEEGVEASDFTPILRDFSDSHEKARENIRDRFVYYSRLATIGTIAQMLIHEIRNRTTIIGYFINSVGNVLGEIANGLSKKYDAARASISSLETFADTFAPLANRAFRRKKRSSNLAQQIKGSAELQVKEMEKYEISLNVTRNCDVEVAVDPGELDIVLLNLFTNAIYWLATEDDEPRLLKISAKMSEKTGYIRVYVNDSGPGIRDEDYERILLPGITSKPDGIGMGLTVCAEIIDGYGGEFGVQEGPGSLGGACFTFDIPLKK